MRQHDHPHVDEIIMERVEEDGRDGGDGDGDGSGRGEWREREREGRFRLLFSGRRGGKVINGQIHPSILNVGRKEEGTSPELLC